MDNNILLFPSGIPQLRCCHLPRDESDPIVPLCCGWQHEKGWLKHIDWDNRTRHLTRRSSGFLFQYTLSGQGGKFLEAERCRQLSPGYAFLIPIPSETRYWLERTDEWSWLWLSGTGEAAMQWIHHFTRRYGFIFKLAPTSAPIQIAAQIYADTACGRLHDSAEASILLYRFMLAFNRAVQAQHQGISPVIRQILEMVEAEFHRPDLTVEDLARQCGRSLSHFCRVFKKEYGLTPGQFIEQVRMQRALELIIFSTLPVHDVAIRCGYRHISHFCHIFNRHFGQSPAQYRRHRGHHSSTS